MKQVITVDHDQIVAAVKEHLSKYISPAYGKEFNMAEPNFKLEDAKVSCDIDIEIVEKEKS